ncbi:MAG: ribbon-helix-helix domain-containing protein [Candidatus Bathyarchaeia archaeon]
MNKNLRITVRVEDSDRKMMEALIQQGKFRSLSDFLRAAIRELLSQNKRCG